MRTRSPEFLLARQPIVDRQRTVVAYELLYRSGDGNAAFFIDDALATTSVVNTAFRRIGISAVIGGARALVNVNAEFLLSRRVEELPQYQLALDDVCHYNETFEPLLEFVDVVKIDVKQLDAASLAILVQKLRAWPARLLAEKVETIGRVKLCLELGIDWFQGFVYGQPVMLAA
jgi:c-di-GMP-related signal transduction protein